MYQAESKSLPRLMRCVQATSSPKMFFASVRRNRQLSHQIITLKTDLGVIVKVVEAQAELFNEFYDAVLRTDLGQPIPALSVPSVMMGIPVFTPCLVLKELFNLDTSKSPGPVQLHPKLLKWLATFLEEPLAG